LKKPLDKSEQCSEWNQRPLSDKQRIYAALDAYVCAWIYSHNFL
jgi:ribonuclease D